MPALSSPSPVAIRSPEAAPPTAVPARRISHRPRLPGGRAVVGGLLMVVAAVGVFLAYTDATAGPSTSYVVAAADLRSGDTIRVDDLRLVPLELPGRVATGAFTNASEVVDHVLLASVAEGEILQASAITAQSPGTVGTEVALALPRDHVAAGRMEIGDRVDVFLTTDDETNSVARGVLVVDLTVSADNDLSIDDDVEIVVAVPDPEVVAALVHALRSGDVTVVRSTFTNPSDEPVTFQPDTGGGEEADVDDGEETPG